MKLKTICAAAAVLVAAALPSTASAFQAPKVTMMKLSVQITGVHLDDWHLQDAGFPDPEKFWVAGKGTQTLGFSTPKPVLYNAVAMSGSVPGGGKLTPLSLAKLSTKPMKGSLRREAEWHPNDGNPCDSEGSCDASAFEKPKHAKPSCPALRRDVGATLEVSRPGGGPEVLTVGFLQVANIASPWPNCPPDIDGAKRPLRLGQPRAVTIAAGIERIAKLRPGASLTLKGSAEMGATDSAGESKSCPALSGVGMQECATTDVTVEIRRLR